jgi:homogentisate 1,2-dioxygenase
MKRSHIHLSRGRVARQARMGLGGLREEHLSRHGFAGPMAMLYHTAGPNEVVRYEGDFRRRAVDTAEIVAEDADDPRGGPLILLSNPDVAIAISRRRHAMQYCYRNCDGDLLYFVHRGKGVFATEFGPLVYEPGDYMLIPKGVTFLAMPDPGDSLMLVVESPEPISFCEHEQVGRYVPFDMTVPIVPEPADYGWPERDEWELRVKHGGAHGSVFYRNNPMRAVGWKGDLFPFKLNIRDIIPLMSDRIHLPPSSWATFEAAGFAIVSFLPQVAVADPDTEELPGYHRNIDMDEVVLTHADDGPAGRRPGGLSHTPQGLLHGASEADRTAFQARRTPGMRRNFTAIGVDTYRPLVVAPAFAALAG